jgi:hypothetical protein
MDGAVSQPNMSDSLAFAPTTASIHSSQSTDFTDSRSCGERLDVPNLAQNLEVHEAIVAKAFNTSQWRGNWTDLAAQTHALRWKLSTLRRILNPAPGA